MNAFDTVTHRRTYDSFTFSVGMDACLQEFYVFSPLLCFALYCCVHMLISVMVDSAAAATADGRQ